MYGINELDNNNQPHTVMHIIGFTEKYYTLWHKSEPYRHETDLYSQERVKYTYLQNLSFDFDKAVEKVKEMDLDYMVDLDLRANRTFYKSGTKEYKPDIFLFGKYRGKKFTEVDDTDYKLWYYDATKEDAEKKSPLLEQQLIESAELLELSDGTLATIDEIERSISEAFSEHVYELDHWGTEKDRGEHTLTVRNTYGYNSSFGWVDVVEMIDAQNRLWFIRGSYRSDVEIEEGDIVVLDGTIAHKSWFDRRLGKERNETQLKRPNIKDVIKYN